MARDGVHPFYLFKSKEFTRGMIKKEVIFVKIEKT